MKREAGDQLTDSELRRAIRKAFKRVEKMIREEPRPIVISEGNIDNSSNQMREITTWLFDRRHDNGNSGN